MCLANVAIAEENHLQVTEEFEKSGDASEMQNILLLGESYINDVKKYHEKLVDDKIDEDFSDEILKSNPDYSQEQVASWQKYIRKGVKTYRRYLSIKNKIVEFLLHDEIPLVVDDDQYEMGENEEYVPTDKPLVIKDFKKVVAYSDNKRDIDAANEKLAKDYNFESPAKIVSKYKKAILNKDWKTLFGFSIKDEIKKHNEKLKSQSDLNDENLRATILTEKQGVDSGVVRWVVVVETKENGFVLFDDYKNYEGIRVDVANLQNLKDIKFGFNMPEEVKVGEFDTIVGWKHRFPIYFEGKVVDSTKDVGLNVLLVADVCYDDGCKRARANPKAKLLREKESNKTLYATFVEMMAYNIPKDDNAKYFKFGKAVWEDGDNQKNIRFEIKTNNPELLRIIPIGKEGKNLGVAQLSIIDGNVVVRFKWKNSETTPVGKTVVFWVAGENNRQYFHAAKIEELSVFDVEGGKFSIGVLGLAFIGGVLLNFMPCVFPVLFLKLLAFTKFGGLNKVQIRRNFTCNSLGILFSFAIMAIILAVLKKTGVALGWGMQFQNVYFMCFIIWVVFIFFMILLGLIRFDANKTVDKVLNVQKKGVWFEFLSGVFLVMLSTPCVAPYLGTVFGIALTSDAKIILLTVMVVGLGLACPYMLIAFVPQIAFAMPKPGKWLNKINLLMKLLLVITLGWLISVLSAQTSIQQIWHWVGYLAIAFVLLFVVYAYKKEIDKEADRELVKRCCRNINIFAFVCMSGLFVWSVNDARTDYMKNMQKREKITVKEIDAHEIKRNLALGNKILVKVGADWCLTCKYNDALVFNTEYIANMIKKENVKVINVDWTSYQEEVLQFMQKFGRTGLPFYVFFSPKYSEGIVLDELIKDFELKNILEL